MVELVASWHTIGPDGVVEVGLRPETDMGSRSTELHLTLDDALALRDELAQAVDELKQREAHIFRLVVLDSDDL